MASIWRPASWKGSFEANRDFGPSLSSAENPSSPLIPLVFFLDFPIGFEAAQRSLSNPAKAQRKLFSWCLYVPESTFVFTISYGYFNEKCQNHSEKWHFLTSFGYYLSFHFFPFGFEGAQGKEIQIILRLFLVCHLLLQTKSVPSQLASNVGGLVIH